MQQGLLGQVCFTLSAGLGRQDRAGELLSESVQTLQDMGQEGLGPLSEARIYLALSRMSDPTAADVAALDSTLLQVIHILALVTFFASFHTCLNASSSL